MRKLALSLGEGGITVPALNNPQGNPFTPGLGVFFGEMPPFILGQWPHWWGW